MCFWWDFLLNNLFLKLFSSRSKAQFQGEVKDNMIFNKYSWNMCKNNKLGLHISR